MDKPVPKLPAYMFTRSNGSFRYKRNVPNSLVSVFGKKTLYRQLGRNYPEAMKAYPLVHAKIEAMFASEANKGSGERALDIIRARLGEGAAEMVQADHVPTLDEFLTREEEDLLDLAAELDGRVPTEVADQIRAGKLREVPITLSTVLDGYEAYKTEDGEVGKDLKTRLARLRREMTSLYGKTKMTHVPLQNIKRSDANDLRDQLLGKMAPNSVQRTIGIVKAAVNFTIREHGLSIINVFAGLNIKGAGASKADRLPLTDAQVQDLLAVFDDNEVTHALFLTLADTGARLLEIVGLEAQDVDLEKRELRITPNSIRGLKTKSSDRAIPLSPRATEALREHVLDLSDSTAPIFPRYARPRGNDAASAMMMKRLRRRITDKKITLHSLRHRMKDKLRNSGCPEHLSKAILGHSTNSVAANYGSGYALNVMQEAMEKVWGE